MHTVIETASFLSAAEVAGMSGEERAYVVTFVTENPAAGVQIPGTGGCRKIRVRKPGRGKSGGYRVITFYTGPDIPVFLLTAFAKSEKDNLTRAERNGLAVLTKELVKSYSGEKGRP